MIVIFSGKKSTWTRGGISVEDLFFCGGTSARKRHTTTDWSTIFAGPFFDPSSDRATIIAFARRRKEEKHHLVRIRISSSFKGQASGAESVQAGQSSRLISFQSGYLSRLHITVAFNLYHLSFSIILRHCCLYRRFVLFCWQLGAHQRVPRRFDERSFLLERRACTIDRRLPGCLARRD